MKSLSIGLAGCIACYLFGAESDRHGIFPMPQLISVREKVLPTKVKPESRYTLDAQDRIIGDAEKPAVACPKQTDRTAVLLVLGQSNAANYGGQRFASKHGDKIVNFFDGQCYVAASPLLGSSGTKGEYWTQLGNHLIESGKFDTVVIAPMAYSGSAVKRWARGGDLNAVLVDTLSKIKAEGHAITHVLWNQGEIDYVVGISEDAYRERLLSMIDTLRGEGVTAPVYLSIASKCLEPGNGGTRRHSANIPSSALSSLSPAARATSGEASTRMPCSTGSTAMTTAISAASARRRWRRRGPIFCWPRKPLQTDSVFRVETGIQAA
jgi:hypothetical protein